MTVLLLTIQRPHVCLRLTLATDRMAPCVLRCRRRPDSDWTGLDWQLDLLAGEGALTGRRGLPYICFRTLVLSGGHEDQFHCTCSLSRCVFFGSPRPPPFVVAHGRRHRCIREHPGVARSDFVHSSHRPIDSSCLLCGTACTRAAVFGAPAVVFNYLRQSLWKSILT